jgi:hypothetical protein
VRLTTPVVALLVLALNTACASRSVARENPEESAPVSQIAGTVEIDGKPVAEVEVAVIDAEGTVVSAAETDEAGAFRLDTTESGWVVAKIRDPFVAVGVQPVSEQVHFALSEVDTVSLRGTIRFPDGVPFDWVDVSVTPRALPGVPDPVLAKLLVVGTGPGKRGGYWNRRATTPEFSIRVQPGTHELRFEHVIDSAPMPFGGPTSLAGDVLTLDDGTRPERQYGAHRVEVSADRAFEVTMRVLGPDEL